MKQHKRVAFLTVAIATALGSCGGGGGGGGESSSGTSITTVGKVDGFGSVYVNGIKFDTSETRYQVDDEEGFDDSSLGLGMVVRVEGEVSDDGMTGIADYIEYDDDLEGPIDAGSLSVGDGVTTFTILGMAVAVDANDTVFDDGASYEGLAEGQELEVSGFFDGTQIVASRIELQTDAEDDYEVKGTVASYDSNGVALVLQNGSIAGPYPLSDSVELDIPADPVGLFVELKLENNGGTVEVVRIESEDRDRLEDEDEDVSLRGILVIGSNNEYSLNGVTFEVSPLTRYEPASLEGSLTAGMEIEVEGRMQGDLLIAEKIEAEDGEIEIEARVSSVQVNDEKNGAITLDLGNGQTVTVQVNNSTLFEDDSDSDLNDDDSFNLSELTDSDYLEIEAIQLNSQYTAVHVEREDEPKATQVEAPLEAFAVNSSLTLVGATFSVDGSTEYEIDDSSVDMERFFSEIEIGSKIELEDDNWDGTADKVELE